MYTSVQNSQRFTCFRTILTVLFRWIERFVCIFLDIDIPMRTKSVETIKFYICLYAVCYSEKFLLFD